MSDEESKSESTEVPVEATPEVAETPPETAAPSEATSTPLREPSRLEVYFPRSLEGDRTAIHVASFPSIMYFWPTIGMFYLCGILQSLEWVAPGTLGWMAIGTFALNVLVIVQDFDQKKFIILMLVIVVGGLAAWIIDMKGFEFLRNITNYLIDLSPTMSTSAYLIFGITLTILFFWGMIRPLFDYWRLEHNEFVHYIQPFGRDMSIPRSGSTVSKGIPDILEFILTLGGGSLIIRREGEVVATIPHIPFLGRRMKVIEKMLSEQRVTTYND